MSTSSMNMLEVLVAVGQSRFNGSRRASNGRSTHLPGRLNYEYASCDQDGDGLPRHRPEMRRNTEELKALLAAVGVDLAPDRGELAACVIDLREEMAATRQRTISAERTWAAERAASNRAAVQSKQQFARTIQALGLERCTLVSCIKSLHEELDLVQKHSLRVKGEALARATAAERLTSLAKDEVAELKRRLEVCEGGRAEYQAAVAAVRKENVDLKEHAIEQEAERALAAQRTSELEVEVGNLKERVVAVMAAGAEDRAGMSVVIEALSKQEMDCRERLMVAERTLTTERKHAMRCQSASQRLEEELSSSKKVQSEQKEGWTEDVSVFRDRMNEVLNVLAMNEIVRADAARRESILWEKVKELEGRLEEWDPFYVGEREEATARTQKLESEVAQETRLIIAEELAREDTILAAAREEVMLGEEMDELQAPEIVQEESSAFRTILTRPKAIRASDCRMPVEM